MSVPLIFRDKNGFPYTREASDVLYAESAGQNCILHFENGDIEFYGYPLKQFHEKVWHTNLFRRLDRFCLVKICRVINRKYLQAIFSNGIILAISRSGNEKLKKYLSGFSKAAF